MAPKIVDKLRDGTFMQAFTHRSDEAHIKLTASIPVKVILNEKIGFYKLCEDFKRKHLCSPARS